MATVDDIEIQMAEMDIENEELFFEVRRFLTENNINTRAMKWKMVDVWRPTMGINIKDLVPGVFLFQFNHKDDM